MMPVRLKDIADDLNLSKMTISKVLRGQADISAETKARVLKRVKELKYIPNINANSLRTGQTMTVGLILPSLHDAHLSEVAEGVAEVIHTCGYGLLVGDSRNDPELEQRQIEMFLSRQVDAILLVSTQETDEFFEQMHSLRKTNLVFMNRKSPGVGERFVSLQEEEVGRIACAHLISCGCRRIAYLRGPRTAIGDLRAKGYRQAITDHGLTFQPNLVADTMGTGETEYRRGFQAMTKLMATRGRPDGVMAYTDMMSAGAMDAAMSAGVKIPAEMRFAGCGNDALLCDMRMPLTSVNLRSYEIGQKAARMALQSNSNAKAPKGRGLIVRPTLVKRASTAG
jgi:LacI family transcriptional regulator